MALSIWFSANEMGLMWHQIKSKRGFYIILQAFGIFDPTYHGIMRSLYDDALKEYNREAAHDSAVSTDALFASLILPLVYFFL